MAYLVQAKAHRINPKRMLRIQNVSHSKLTLAYASLQMFERAGFYGINALAVFHLMDDPFAFSKEEAGVILGWLVPLMLLSNLLGALLGDLLIQNKRVLIIGAFVQAAGAFTLALPSLAGLYVGLAGIIIGGGMFSSNLRSQFGKLYLAKTQLLDAGFSILFLMVNIGSFFGVLLAVMIGEKFGFHFGFILAGCLLLIAGLIPAIVKDREFSESNLQNAVVKVEHSGRLVLFFSMIALFWVCYELTALPVHEMQVGFSRLQYQEMHYWLLLAGTPLIAFDLIFPVIWSYYYTNEMVKLAIGCVSATLPLQFY